MAPLLGRANSTHAGTWRTRVIDEPAAFPDCPVPGRRVRRPLSLRASTSAPGSAAAAHARGSVPPRLFRATPAPSRVRSACSASGSESVELRLPLLLAQVTGTKSRGSRTKEGSGRFQSRSPSDDYGPPLQDPENGRPFPPSSSLSGPCPASTVEMNAQPRRAVDAVPRAAQENPMSRDHRKGAGRKRPRHAPGFQRRAPRTQVAGIPAFRKPWRARLTRRAPDIYSRASLRIGRNALLWRLGQQQLFRGLNNPYWRAFLHQLVNSMRLSTSRSGRQRI